MPGRKLFDWIAPVYGRYFTFQKKMYTDVLETVSPHISLTGYETVLDVGCGTGAFAAVMLEQGFRVTGIDTSEKMLAVAKKRVVHPDAQFILADGARLPFDDDSFDLVFASYVLHGMPRPERLDLYREMKRVASHLVIVHDYNRVRSPLTDLAEWAERGDYFSFIRVVEDEMAAEFPAFEVIPAGDKANWYVGRKKGVRL